MFIHTTPLRHSFFISLLAAIGAEEVWYQGMKILNKKIAHQGKKIFICKFLVIPKQNFCFLSWSISLVLSNKSYK